MRVCTMFSLARSNVCASSSQSIFVSLREKSLASTFKIVLRLRLSSIRSLNKKKKDEKREEKRDERNREEKKNEKKKKTTKLMMMTRKRRRRCSSRADRCQQATSNSNFCHHRKMIVFSSFHQKINNFVNKFKIDYFLCSFDVSSKSMIKNLVRKNLKKVRRKILVSSSTFIDAFIVLC